MNKGCPKKPADKAFVNRRNVRLSDRYSRMLDAIADHKEIPAETLLRDFSNEGIRREYAAIAALLKNDASTYTA